MIFWGIFSGLMAAMFQSGGYILSRIYIKKYQKPLTLMVIAQLWIALFSVPLLLMIWKDNWWGDFRWVWPMLLAAIGTTGGELMFFRAEKSIAPSRLSSLLGLRVMVLAIASFCLGIERYNYWQCGGIVLAAASAFVMNYQNGRFNFNGMGYLAAALGFYCISDLSIKFLIDGVNGGTLWHSALLAVCAINLLIGIVLLPLVFILRLPRREFIPGLPYSCSWFLKQMFLYGCYAMVGPVFGNVIMTARGPIAIGLTLFLLHLGVHNLETPKSLEVWVRRGIATVMMVTAIVVYSLV